MNIQCQLNIDGVTKHSNDLMSTCARVEEVEQLAYNPMEQLAYNPVLMFKPQGVDNTSGLVKDDFMLAIQSEFQKDAMMMYGAKGILVDTTRGTTQYDFLLITVLVVDDHGEGLPVAWAISDKEDLNAITQFFEVFTTESAISTLLVLCRTVLSNILMFGQLCLDAVAQRNCYAFGTLTVPGDELSMITSVKNKTE